MIDFDFSAVVYAICRQTSAEVKSYTQHHCHGKYKHTNLYYNIFQIFQPLLCYTSLVHSTYMHLKMEAVIGADGKG